MQWYPSPNHDERKLPINILLVHYTNMENAPLALARLCDSAAKVSAHYLIDETGEVFHLVKEQHRAWHAGESAWKGERDINSASIGIELQHKGHRDGTMAGYPTAQMQSFTRLAQEIIARHNIPPTHILGHSDVAPYRKQDPGEGFDWQSLAKQGVGVWIDNPPLLNAATLKKGDSGDAVLTLQTQLAQYGYDIICDGIFAQRTEKIIIAFQRHFTPHNITGSADAATISYLDALTQKD